MLPLQSLLPLLLLLQLSYGLEAQTVLLFEDFESGDFEAKGWYDGFPDHRTSSEFKHGMYSYEGHFSQGATTSGAGRHLFPASDKVYLSYWVKYSTNYIGSGVPYHPHEWNMLTDADWIYQGPADTYLTAYIEQNAGRPIIALQDSKNVDPNCILLNNDSFVGCNGDFDSYVFTENRSVSSCNGLIGSLDRRDCFPSSGSSQGYYSSRAWAADTVYFRNTPGPYYKNDWHLIETYFEMNTIQNGKGLPDGKIRYWYDGQLLISYDSILFRTGAHPDLKFNQLFYGPYIGVGSPVDQTWWVDDLLLMDGLPESTSAVVNMENHDWQIYPNPAHDAVILRFASEPTFANNTVFEMYTSTGELIFSKKIDTAREIIFPEFIPGMYTCRIRYHNGKMFAQRIIIQ